MNFNFRILNNNQNLFLMIHQNDNEGFISQLSQKSHYFYFFKKQLFNQNGNERSVNLWGNSL